MGEATLLVILGASTADSSKPGSTKIFEHFSACVSVVPNAHLILQKHKLD